MQNLIQFSVVLPTWPEEPSDIVGGRLVVSLDGQVLSENDVSKNVAEVALLEGPQGSTVDVSFVYVDDAGNESKTPATASVVLTDTVPPSDPGTLSVVVTGERVVE